HQLANLAFAHEIERRDCHGSEESNHRDCPSARYFARASSTLALTPRTSSGVQPCTTFGSCKRLSSQSSTLSCLATRCGSCDRSKKPAPSTITYTGVVCATAPLTHVVRAAIHWLSPAGSSKSASSFS